MEALLERLSSGQIVAVVSILVGGIVALAMIFAISKYQFHWLAEETALARDKHQAELAVKQKMIERGLVGAAGAASVDALLAADVLPTPAAELDAQLAKRFGSLEAEAGEIEATLRRALATDAERKRAIRDVIDELYENDAPHEAILAAARALCRQAAPAKEVASTC